MENLKKNKFLIVFCVILIIVSVVLLYSNGRKDGDYYQIDENFQLKHYEENEYIPVSISYDQMARIYLQDYVYKLIYKREDAYNYLDEEYRKVKFPTFDDFNSYVDTIMSKKLQEMVVSKYSIDEGSDYRDFNVYDSGDNYFVFREKGVMQYTVCFDRYTVNMK